jgi:hypothetical protein
MLWAILILTTCGYRTPPEPYEQRAVDLPGITGASLNFRADDLVFRWRLSDERILGTEGRVRLLTTRRANLPVDTADATHDTDADSNRFESAASVSGNVDNPQVDEEPAAVIQLFRLNVFGEVSDCSECGPVLLARIILPLFDGQTFLETMDERIWRQAGSFVPSRYRLSWNPIEGFVFALPADLFDEGALEDRCFFSIDYMTTDERFALSSPRLYPRRPHLVPLPEVTVRKLVSVHRYPLHADPRYLVWSDFLTFIGVKTAAPRAPAIRDGHDPLPLPLWIAQPQTEETVFIETSVYDPQADACRAPTVHYFLLLRWQPRHETLVHIETADGRLHESVQYYGVNLYRFQPIDPAAGIPTGRSTGDGGFEERINAQPLLNGSFSLSNFHDRLYARHVDRFGNESMAVLVFDGRYE